MSAFLVDREHIRFLISAAQDRSLLGRENKLSWYHDRQRKELLPDDRDGASSAGQMLWDANLKSINARYPDTVGKPENVPGRIGETYIYAHSRSWGKRINPVEALKAIACFDYQACEDAGYWESEARDFLDSLTKVLIQALPGYDEAAWEVNGEEDTLRPSKEEKAKAAADKHVLEVARLRKAVEYAELLKLSETNQDRLTTAAKNIRTELKRSFPKTKFAVKTKRYSGGNSVNVNWTDGPTQQQVDKIVKAYSAGDFDGSTDTYNYTGSAWVEVFGEAKYAFTSRTYSKAFVERVIKAKGYEGQVNIEGTDESAWVRAEDRSTEHWVRQALQEEVA